MYIYICLVNVDYMNIKMFDIVQVLLCLQISGYHLLHNSKHEVLLIKASIKQCVVKSTCLLCKQKCL